MSSWLTWARYYAGSGPKPNLAAGDPKGARRPAAVERKLAAARAAEESGESQEVVLQRNLNSQQVKNDALEEEIKDLTAESKALVLQIKDPKVNPKERAVLTERAKSVLKQCAERNHELETGKKRAHNLQGQLSVFQTANANVDHALLVQQGANELESIVAVMEELNVEDNVDRLRDAASQVHEHSNILGSDMGLSGNPMAGEAQDYLVDEELEALIRAQHDNDMDALLGQIQPTPATAAGAAGAKVPEDGAANDPLLATHVN